MFFGCSGKGLAGCWNVLHLILENLISLPARRKNKSLLTSQNVYTFCNTKLCIDFKTDLHLALHLISFHWKCVLQVKLDPELHRANQFCYRPIFLPQHSETVKQYFNYVCSFFCVTKIHGWWKWLFGVLKWTCKCCSNLGSTLGEKNFNFHTVQFLSVFSYRAKFFGSVKPGQAAFKMSTGAWDSSHHPHTSKKRLLFPLPSCINLYVKPVGLTIKTAHFLSHYPFSCTYREMYSSVLAPAQMSCPIGAAAMTSRIKPVTVSVTFAQVNFTCMLTLGPSKSEHGFSLNARWYQTERKLQETICPKGTRDLPALKVGQFSLVRLTGTSKFCL